MGASWRWGASTLAVSACVASSALISPSDVVRNPDRVFVSARGACAWWSDGSLRCWGSTPFAARSERPWALPSPRAPVRDVATLSSEVWHRGVDDCVVSVRDRLECARAEAPPLRDANGTISEGRWFGPLETPPALHDVRSPRVAIGRVCVLARDASERDSVWCIERDPTREREPSLVRDGWRRMPLGSPRAIAMGLRELCALYATGPVRCIEHFGEAVRAVEGTDDAVQLVVADDFGCVRTSGGLVSCWGNGTVGQLGDGSFDTRRDARPIALAGPFDDVAAFGGRACALRDGAAWCWGRLRPWSSLPAIVSARPVLAAEVSGARTLAIADGFACATRTDGTVWCWGNDAAGQLGDGTSMPHRGCWREGISGTSPEQERMQPPTPVRTGEAGAHPRARRVLLAALLALVAAPLALVIEARRRSSVHVTSALLVAAFVPMLVARLANAALAVWFRACSAWECEIPSFRGIEHATLAGSFVTLSFMVVVYGHGRMRDADEHEGATRMARIVAFAALPALLVSMSFTSTVNVQNAVDSLPYFFRDRALEGVTWPFAAQWWWTIGWIALAVAFVLQVELGELRRA